MVVVMSGVVVWNHQGFFFGQHRSFPTPNILNKCHHKPLTLLPYPSSHILFLSSSSSLSSSSVVEDEDGLPSSDTLPFQPQSEDALTLRGCKACGREEIEKGCNGEGRIQGGIATVPGFGWWPIKAYRPCPGFVASGGRYTRRGQSMDEVAFGRGAKPPPSPPASVVDADSEDDSRKKMRDPRRFKR